MMTKGAATTAAEERYSVGAVQSDRVIPRFSAGKLLERKATGGKVWAVSFALWTLLALFSAAGSGVYFAVAQGHLPAWKGPLLWSLTDAYTWALISPLLYGLAKRYSFGARSWKVALLFHLAAGILCAYVAALFTITVNLAVPGGFAHNGMPFRVDVIALFLTNVPRYWLVVAVSQAIIYYSKFRERELKSTQLETQLANAQLQALKMQLEPHFLFNVLNSIASLSRVDAAATEKMTLQLAELLRLSLSNIEVHEVPLGRELEFLECYLRIQETRFRDRLSIYFAIEPAALQAVVPHLILQPLVENAIRHGTSPRLAAGRVEVHARLRDDRITLQVVDDGVGLPADFRESQSGGVGLKNTRARLQQLYGENYQFTCENLASGGCRVSIAVPFRMKGGAGGYTHPGRG
ncbi:MAG: histidine kinase [Acidobacteriaceae bacterium]